MRSLQDLRAERSENARKARNVVDNWKPGDSEKEVDAIYARIDELDAQIGALERQVEIEARLGQPAKDRAAREGTSVDEASDRIANERKVFKAWLRGGERALDDDMRRFVAERRRQVMGAQSIGTPSEGGYLAPTDFAAVLIERMAAFGGMRSVATVIQTDHGRQIDYPTTDDTSEEGEIIAENTTATDADAAFGTVNIGAYKYSSKIITVPIELLQDSRIDIEAHVRDRLARRLARVTNKHFTTGTGTGQPRGIVTASVVGKAGAAGQTVSVTYDDLVDLEHAIDPAYRANGASFMFHDTTLKVLKKLKDADGRPLWRPGVTGGDANDILGYGYTINQHMPVMAASAKSILFGQLSKYVIRDIMDVTLFRFDDSAYMKKGQIAFLAWMRSDGDLVDVDPTTAVKHYANSAT